MCSMCCGARCGTRVHSMCMWGPPWVLLGLVGARLSMAAFLLGVLALVVSTCCGSTIGAADASDKVRAAYFSQQQDGTSRAGGAPDLRAGAEPIAGGAVHAAMPGMCDDMIYMF